MRGAAEELTVRGYYVLRVGSAVEKPLFSSNPRIIDYSSSKFRSDFLDIYLLSKAKFFLGNDSGIWAVPAIFRRPFAMTNFSYLAHFYENDYPWLFIPKRIRDSRTGNFLTLRETLGAGLGAPTGTSIFSAAGVELVNNSSAEILDFAVELDDRLKGIWQVDQADEESQRRFWYIFDKYTQGRSQTGNGWVARGVPTRRARIGTGFLRRHPNFLR
jgi:putative glycosyltransferase (TIGR04372 family)